MEDRHSILSAIRNPLSIIALFVLLIELMASLAMTNSSLTDAQRSWFVVFCVVFPTIVFLLFFLIAWCRPQNLYGPQDYSDDKVFLKLMRQGKIEDEVEDIVASEKEDGADSRMAIVARIARSEQKVMVELQKEFHSPVLREIRSARNDYYFDGLIKIGNRLVYVEVKYIPNGMLSFRLLEQVKRFVQAADTGEKLLAIVSPTPLSDAEKEKAKSSIESISHELQLRFYVL